MRTAMNEQQTTERRDVKAEPKAPYRKPEIVEFGSIEQLTLGFGGPYNDTGSSRSNKRG